MYMLSFLNMSWKVICLQNFTIFDWKYIQNMMCKRGNLAV